MSIVSSQSLSLPLASGALSTLSDTDARTMYNAITYISKMGTTRSLYELLPQEQRILVEAQPLFGQ
jgi:hypothetical protein